MRRTPRTPLDLFGPLPAEAECHGIAEAMRLRDEIVALERRSDDAVADLLCRLASPIDGSMGSGECVNCRGGVIGLPGDVIEVDGYVHASPDYRWVHEDDCPMELGVRFRKACFERALIYRQRLALLFPTDEKPS